MRVRVYDDVYHYEYQNFFGVWYRTGSYLVL